MTTNTIVPRPPHEPQQNPFYQDLVSLMTSPCFQRFSTKYMGSWTDIETALLYIKLYESLAQYLDAPHDIVAVIHKVMNTDLARKRAIHCFRDFQTGRNQTLVWQEARTLKK